MTTFHGYNFNKVPNIQYDNAGTTVVDYSAWGHVTTPDLDVSEIAFPKDLPASKYFYLLYDNVNKKTYLAESRWKVKQKLRSLVLSGIPVENFEVMKLRSFKKMKIKFATTITLPWTL